MKAMSNPHITLEEFAKDKTSTIGAWIDDLPDDIFNEVWDAFAAPAGSRRYGKVVICEWLLSMGYEGATQGKLHAVTTRERRPEN
jgi:hypothetical protein